MRASTLLNAKRKKNIFKKTILKINKLSNQIYANPIIELSYVELDIIVSRLVLLFLMKEVSLSDSTDFVFDGLEVGVVVNH